MTHPARNGGYIMLEAAVALVLLTAGVYAVHGTIRQAIEARGQAQDYTKARFLLQEVLADLEMQPLLKEEPEQRGRFPSPNERFSWSYTVRRVDVPLPPAPSVNGRELLYPMKWLGHIRVTVYWQRGGQDFEESFETLVATEKLWQPKDRRR